MAMGAATARRAPSKRYLRRTSGKVSTGGADCLRCIQDHAITAVFATKVYNLPAGPAAGELISLLRPPASVALPLLSDAQRAAIPQLRQKARQGTATVVYQRWGGGGARAAGARCF